MPQLRVVARVGFMSVGYAEGSIPHANNINLKGARRKKDIIDIIADELDLS